MKICAIISEYNPLHKGHIYHIQKAKEISDAIIVILTGHTTQRGEFSIFNKWTKTKTALLAGANLILEMPTIFSSSSAENFSNAAIKIIKELKIVDILSFGSEYADIEKMIKLAKVCKNIDKTEKMKNFLKQGYSYPKARQLAIGKEGEILKYPNNLLGVEYIKSALNLKLNISFHTIKRIGAFHNENPKNSIASSSYIRQNIKNLPKIKKYIEEKFLSLYKDPILIPDIFIFNALRNCTKETLKNLPDTTEGLYNRIFKAFEKATSLEEFFNLVKTKRYTLTRLKRIALYSFFNINKQKINKFPQYSYILGFDKIGQEILSSIKKNNNFLFTTNFKKIYHNFPYSAKIDCQATDFVLLFEKNPKPCGMNFKTKPIIF